MSVLRPETVRKIFKKRPEYRGIQTFIETGTYLAKTIRNMQGLFEHLHTIELSEELYKLIASLYGHLDIDFHLGDSAVLLPKIARRVDGPVFFYLDAHGFDRPQVAAGFPIWEELGFIRGRQHADIVVVDDVATFGTKTKSKRVESGWAGMSPRAILDFLGPERNNGKMVENNSLIVFRKAARAEARLEGTGLQNQLGITL